MLVNRSHYTGAAEGGQSDGIDAMSHRPLLPRNDHGMSTVEIQSVPCISKCFSLFPLFWFGACYTLEPRQEAVLFHYGSVTGHQKKPGMHFAIPAGLKIQKISTKQKTISLPDCKITDKVGNPIICSAVINYRVVDGKKAIMNIENVGMFVMTNATAVLKQVVSQHTYDELKRETIELNGLMRSSLQQRTHLAGVNIGSMEINELNYAPEIACGMLKKQQAQALVAARHVIVAGATEIARDAIKRLEEGEQGMTLSVSDKAKIVTNLLTVTCSDSNAVPTIAMF